VRRDFRWCSADWTAEPASTISGVPDPKLEIQLLYDRILVKVSQEEGERRSSGGIVIPATAQMAKRLAWGDVLGIGNNVRNVKVGDRVLYNPDDQLEVEIQAATYLVMRERDVHAVAAERTEHGGTGLYL
jgi:chaperonin GroES